MDTSMASGEGNERTIVELLGKLEEILVVESDVLSGPLTANLGRLTAEKERILNRIDEITQSLRQIPLIDQRIVEKLTMCQRINEENNLLVNQRLKVIRDANQIVRNQSGVGSVELYDGGGKLVQSTNSKPLSEA